MIPLVVIIVIHRNYSVILQDFRENIMNPTVVGIIVFTCTFGGALLGMRVRKVLQEHHVSGESKDTVKVATALIATMTALVLGLVTASAKSSFDSTNTAIKQTAAQILALDRALAPVRTRSTRDSSSLETGSW